MKKSILLFLSILLFSCNQSNTNNTKTDTSNTTDKESKNNDSIDMKTLFSWSPLSIFDGTTESLDASEKENLLQKGESASWKIYEENKASLKIKAYKNDDEVKLYFLKNKKDANGILAAEVTNGEISNIQLLKYNSKDKSLAKSDDLKKYSANDFVSESDKLPAHYQPVLHYQFVDDQTIEVSLYTWMDKEFENREIANRIFLKWNGEIFEEQIVKNEQGQGSNKFSMLDRPNYDISKLKYNGKIVHQRIWQDANGENIALFTRKKNELFAYHYAVNSNVAKELRKVYDFEKQCEFDLFLEFIENSIQVTDLDNNNFGELTFAYKKACISDVSPKDLKLLMLENGNKFIIRGTTLIEMPGAKIDDTKKVDASFDNAPASFLTHAVSVWDKVKNEKY